MPSHWRKVTLFLSTLILLAGLGVSALSIETFENNLDINAVSPNSEIAQVIKVTDSQGEMVNQSVLLNSTGNEFQYLYTGNNWSEMRHLTEGYYYAMFETEDSASDITYRIIDQSPGGGTTEVTEDLTSGQLDVNIQSNYSGRFEAGEEIPVNVTVENLGEYYAVDVDGSGDVSENDILITDDGGSGTFSKSSDDVLAGSSPLNGWTLDNNNPWNSGTHTVAMMDSNSGDGWDPGSDIIVRDRFSGGTVSTRNDSALNTGDDSSVETAPGTSLNALNSISNSIYYVSSDQGLDSGEEVVFDNDSDERFTREEDLMIAGSEQTEGTNVTFTDNVPERMGLASYDENGGGFSASEDVVVFDRDNDSIFTSRPDQVLLGAEPSEASVLNGGHVESWNDGDPGDATPSDLETHDGDTGDGGWNASRDAIWIERTNNNGYQPSEDTLVAGNPSQGQIPTQVNDLFDQWPNVSGYDRNSGDTGFDSAADAIIYDYNSGGTYSGQSDTIVGGSISQNSDFSAGTEYTSGQGFPSDWSLDVIETIDGGRWESSQDTILIDRYNGGTFSPSQDEVINHGGSMDSPTGTPLRRLSTAPGVSLMWSDLDSNNAYTSGDEIFKDNDNDTQYTSRNDDHLAGLSLDIAGPGTQLQTLNLWQETNYDQTPILFYDRFMTGVWNSDWDAIVHDTDQDNVFTGQQDRIIEGDPSAGENGDELIDSQPPNTSSPNVYATATTGSNTTTPIQLGRTQQGLYTGTVTLPEVSDSRILLQVWAETPVSRLKGIESRQVWTRAQGIGFDTDKTSIGLDIQKKGNYTRQIRVDNLLDDQNTVDINISDSLVNITDSFDETVDIPAGDNSSANFTFRMQDLQDINGEITFTEEGTGISQTVEVSVDTPECRLQTFDLCVTNTESLEATTGQRENISMNLDLLNTGYRGSQRQVEITVSGTISEYVSVENSSEFMDSVQLPVEMNAKAPGNYSGTLNLETSGGFMEIPLELSATFEELEAVIEVTPTEVDLGTVPTGNDKSVENIMVENSGTVDLENISFTSSSYTIEQDSDEGIQEGDSRNFTLTFKSVQSIEGQVEVTGNSGDQSISKTLDVSGSTIKPVSSMTSEISSEVSSLRTRASSSSAMTQLTEVETQISSIQTSWDKGNYQEAKNKYQSAMSDLTAVEAQIQSNSQGSSQTGQTGSGTGSGQQSSQEDSGGGGGILILLFLLIIILGAGFVLYTSYYPEEGDPLYDVLGDRE